MVRRTTREVVKPWKYRGEFIDSLEDCPEGSYGFIYLITSSSGQKYIGKKALHSYHTVYSRVLNERTGRTNKVKNVEVTESNWQSYFGSSIEIKNLIKSEGTKQNFSREILRFCFSKKELTFREIQEQCSRNVLDDDCYINSNIAGKFFKGEFVKHETGIKSKEA